MRITKWQVVIISLVGIVAIYGVLVLSLRGSHSSVDSRGAGSGQLAASSEALKCPEPEKCRECEVCDSVPAPQVGAVDFVSLLKLSHIPLREDGIIDIPRNENYTAILLDVGLSTGAPNTAVWLRERPTRISFGFEPNPFSYSAVMSGKAREITNPLFKNVLPSDCLFDRFYAMNVACDDESHWGVPFYCTLGDPGTSSLLKPTRFDVKVLVNVVTIRLDMFFKHLPWEDFPYVEMLKTDTQGNDLKVLQGAGSYLKDRVVCVAPEFEATGYEGADAGSSGKIKNYLSSQGFKPLAGEVWINTKYEHLKAEGVVACTIEGL